MPLGFLVPAFLLGLAALVIPILVHLTRKRKARVVEFPSLLFLEQVPFKAEARRRIHHWLLLLLRAALVCFVVAAFARPFFTGPETSATSGGGPREVVVLIDRSYSMGIGDRWEAALETAREVASGMGPLDRVSLVFFAKNATVAVRSTSDQGQFLAGLDTVAVSDESTVYGPGLKLAQTILEETELPGRELVMVGDFQRAGWTGDEGVSLPDGTVVTPVQLGSDISGNTAVASVNLPRQPMAGGRDRVTPMARITRVGGEEEEVAEVVLELEGRELQRQSVVLPANGAANVIFDPFNLSQNHTQGAVRMAGADELAPDDVHYFVISPGRAISVLILDEGGARRGSSFFLSEALAVSQENTFSVAVRAGAGIDQAALDGASVVVVNDRALAGENQAAALRSYVEGGGGLLVAMGERFRWPSELAGLLPGAYTEPIDRRDGRGGRLGYLDYNHPVFEIFRGPRTGDFTGARFYRSRDLQVAESDSVQILARYDDGSVALAEKRVGEGRVLVWTSTLDTFWNDLARQPVFLPFVHQVVRYASGRSESVSSFTAGQILDVTDGIAMATAGLGEVAEALAGEEERVALSPSGESSQLPSGEGPHFLHLVEQGVYEIRPPGATDMRALSVAVNVDLAEADLAAMDVEEVAASIVAPPLDSDSPRGEGARAAQLRLEDQERRQSLWRFLLLTVLVMLAVETVVSNRISRSAVRRGVHAGA
jgi:hypothetical protein